MAAVPKKNGHGGKRAGAGPKKGVPVKIANVKAAIQLKFLAQADEVIAQLLKEMKNDPEFHNRFIAAQELLNRGMGKVPEQQQVTGANGGPIQTQQQHLVAVADLSVLGRGDLKTLETLLAHTLVAQGDDDDDIQMKMVN